MKTNKHTHTLWWWLYIYAGWFGRQMMNEYFSSSFRLQTNLRTPAGSHLGKGSWLLKQMKLLPLARNSNFVTWFWLVAPSIHIQVMLYVESTIFMKIEASHAVNVTERKKTLKKKILKVYFAVSEKWECFVLQLACLCVCGLALCCNRSLLVFGPTTNGTWQIWRSVSNSKQHLSALASFPVNP